MFHLDGRELGSESGVDRGSSPQVMRVVSGSVGIRSGGVASHSRVSVGLTIWLIGRVQTGSGVGVVELVMWWESPGGSGWSGH